MSSKHKEKFTCPKCKAKGEFEMWDTINVDLNPEMREAIFSEEAFKYKCPECGSEITVAYDFIYHDMTHKFMIMFEFFEPDDYICDSFDVPDIFETLKGYTYRQVKGLRELKEKILILEKGLNDVAIERMKHAILHYECPDFVEKGLKFYFEDIRYNIPDLPLGGILLRVNSIADKSKIFALPLNYYNQNCLACEIDERMKVKGCENVCDGWISMKLSGKKEKKLLEPPEESNRGFYIIKKTIRKSKNNPNTRYVQGIAHVNGDILFPLIFDSIRWFGEKEAALADLGDKTYILDIRGGFFDPVKYKEEQEIMKGANK